MKKIIVIQMIAAGLIWTADSATFVVTNLNVSQRAGTKLVEITYDLVSDMTNAIAISVNIKNGTNTISTTNFTGQVGDNILPGNRKQIVWNMGEDWNLGTTPTGVCSVIAVPPGGDPTASAWQEINSRWIKNTYTNGNITMSDRQTGTMWCYDAANHGRTSWYLAMNYCNDLVYAGHSDWQLPSSAELSAQYSQRAVFTNVLVAYDGNYVHYWSRTQSSSGAADALYIWNGTIITTFSTANILWVWPVRSWRQAITAAVFSATTTANFDSRDYKMTVFSSQGAPFPVSGTNLYDKHAAITCSVDSVVNNNGTNYTCIGWTGTGDVPASGNNNSTGPLVLANLNSSITWLWQVSGDRDGDGIPDTWAYQYSGNATGIVASVDDDGDGYSNYQEYRFGTNPTNAQSRFEFSCLAPADKNYAGLYFTTAAGRDYTIEYRSSLTDGSWQPLFTLPGSGSPLNLKDYNIGQQRFYRVNVNMP